MNAVRSIDTTRLVTASIYRPALWYVGDNNLHHGRFLFRHKGKRKKGSPNYPPTKLVVKSRRQWRRPLPPDLKADLLTDSRKSKRSWTQAIMKHNDELRPQRVRKRALGQRVPRRLQALGVV